MSKKVDVYFSFPSWRCDFFFQGDSAKEERRDQRGRLKGKQRELGRKDRHHKRGHGREETTPGKCKMQIESSYAGLRAREWVFHCVITNTKGSIVLTTLHDMLECFLLNPIVPPCTWDTRMCKHSTETAVKEGDWKQKQDAILFIINIKTG